MGKKKSKIVKNIFFYIIFGTSWDLFGTFLDIFFLFCYIFSTLSPLWVHFQSLYGISSRFPGICPICRLNSSSSRFPGICFICRLIPAGVVPGWGKKSQKS